MDVVELIYGGMGRCESIAVQLKVSKGRVSQLAKKAAALGYIKKEGRSYVPCKKMLFECEIAINEWF